MVLEPLSAFAVACNVLQVVETGTKLVNKATEYKNATDGMLDEQRDLRAILLSLRRLNDDLQTSLPSSAVQQSSGTAEGRLIEANQACLRLSKEFISLLDRLQVKRSNAFFETIRMSAKSMMYKERIQSMDKNLSRARDNLNLSFLVFMNSKQAENVTQSDLTNQNSRLEGSILHAVNSSSTLVCDEVKDLGQRLEGMKLVSVQPAFEGFITEHKNFLNHLSYQLDSICATHDVVLSRTEKIKDQETRQSLIGSLYFSQIQDRRDHIHSAWRDTYRWILSPQRSADTRWDDFITWLGDPSPRRNIYWISSKPGAGKSSLIRFLDENMQTDLQMQQPWAQQMRVIQAQYYFWNSGNALQKTLQGFLRTILYQIFEELPDILPSCVPLSKSRLIRSVKAGNLSWTDYELLQCLRAAISCVASSKKFFFLVDGLDEIDGDDDTRDELVDILWDLASNSNVKMCVSSRRWTVFEDAFSTCPQMRLEDLNGRDIETFVRGQFLSQRRYQDMLRYDTGGAEGLVKAIISRAEGVFLWVRLVVKEILRGLRDGDSNRTLQRKLESIPSDLSQYFDKIMESIEPDHRWEASAMLQIGLFQEHEFIALQPLRLIDFIFSEEARIDFALSEDREFHVSSFLNAESLFDRLQSTLRRLSSRCKGLLECYYHPGSAMNDFDLDKGHFSQLAAEAWRDMALSVHNVTSLPSTFVSILQENKYTAFNFKVDWMHRSLRDYLLEPGPYNFLQNYTGGPFDARNYLRNARLMQIFMAVAAGLDPSMTVGLASNVISTLSIPQFRGDPRSAHFVRSLKPLLNHIRDGYRPDAGHWYICRSFECWDEEQSNFLTLAVDFGLIAYLLETLTPEDVREKTGRPLLDYVLRPRFAAFVRDDFRPTTGNQYVIPELVQKLLSLGADPNQAINDIPIWPLFLSSVAFTGPIWSNSQTIKADFIQSIEAMIRHGAKNSARKLALSAPSSYGVGIEVDVLEDFDETVFDYRWPISTDRLHPLDNGIEEIRITEILECLKPIFGSSTDDLKALVCQQAAGDSTRTSP